MDVLTLIDHARAAGLLLVASGDRLIVRGPVSAAPLARALGRHKSEVMYALLAARNVYVYETESKRHETRGFVDANNVEIPQTEVSAPLSDLEEIDCPPPCPKCGSLEL